MGNLKIFGHKNPDLDSIASSIACKELLKCKGIKAEACRLGELNKEAKFVADTFGINLEELKVITSLDDKEEVVLVDHNDFNQSASNIENAKIKMVIDHHKIDNFRTAEPLEYIAKPVGCTCTILYDMLKKEEYNFDNNAEVVVLLMSAILSDTLMLKSPTTTEEDIEAARELAIRVDLNSLTEYGLDLLKAGADLADVSAEGIINIDSKLFEANDKKIQIAQINAVDIDSIISRQKEIEEAMKKVITDNTLDVFLLAVTDIINCNSEIIALGNKTDIIEKAFDIKLKNNRAFLSGVVSRKKQIVPNIMDASK